MVVPFQRRSGPTDEQPVVVFAYRPDAVPAIPGTEEVDFLWTRGCLVLCWPKDLGEGKIHLLETGLSEHGHVDNDVHAARNVQCLLDGARVQHNSATTLILTGTWDDDAPCAAEGGIGELKIQDLARDARDERVLGAEIDPRARVGDQAADVVAGTVRGVLVGQSGHDGSGERLVRLVSVTQPPGLPFLEMGLVQLYDAVVEVLVGDGRSDKLKLSMC